MKRITFLNKWLRQRTKVKRKRNWKAITLSLAAGLIFWFFNALNKDYTTQINYPISFGFDNEDIVIKQDLPEYITINASGSGWNLLRKTLWFNLDPVEIFLDNPTKVQSLSGYSLLDDLANKVPDIRVNFVATDSLYFDIESKISKTVNIEIDSQSISIRDGFRLVSDVKLDPDSVQIVGAQTEVDRFSDFLLLGLDQFQNIDESFDQDVVIDRDLPKHLSIDPGRINVNFTIERIASRSLPVKLIPLNFPNGALLKDTTVTLYFDILQSHISALDTVSLSTTVDYNNYDQQASKVTFSIDSLPSFIFNDSLSLSETSLRYE